ncbi:MAG: hypothetical protein R6X21_07465 [Candidatus Aminicenantes bacterium]
MPFPGGEVEGPSVEKAMELSEDRYCPVPAMLKASAPIKAGYKINPA